MCSHNRPQPGLTSGPRTPRLLAALAVATAALLLTPAMAHAAPSPAEVEKQIDEQWNKLEPIVEEHNATKAKLAKQRDKARALDAQLAPLKLQAEVTRARIGTFADHLYRGGQLAQFSLFLSRGDGRETARRLNMVGQMAREKQARIADVLVAKAELDKVKEPLDALVAQLSKEEAEQAGRARKIESEIAKLNRLRMQAYASGSGLGDLRPAACPASYPGGAAAKAAQFACRQIGKDYVWGSAGPNTFDCSGLVMAAWNSVGVGLPHNAKAQRSKVASVSRANLRPGDLVFYYSDLHHVGMYVGGGWIVHASRPGKPIAMRKMDDGNIHSFGRPA
ncbi:NlpC/P60 family protein [Catellatospora sp. KI3]|uniref:C40 family peptidase n=1 Tax=Catellatospora sp. KI3 TaxID=3041620 RepID=UPI00248218E0|nr:C40 family peptidase [Catellatospora sp. KI3]MDI1464215.1 NlpC/P60 family protein [Catellatospora sp. KI3]